MDPVKYTCDKRGDNGRHARWSRYIQIFTFIIDIILFSLLIEIVLSVNL
jgi:hypothetical protein